MAVANMTNSQLRLLLDNGVDSESGKQLVKTKGFNSVKTSATADQLYAIANAIAPLQQRALLTVERKDSSEISAV